MSLADFRIRTTGNEPELAPALADILIECVQGGASVSFMWPLSHDMTFWQSVIDSAQRGERMWPRCWYTIARAAASA